METRITKETDGIESYDREKGQKEQCSDTKDEDRKLRGGRVSARKTNGERTRESTACRKVTGEKVTVDEGGDNGAGEERRSCDRRKDEGKKGSESKCVEREVNNRDDDRKKRGREKRNNREGGRKKSL